MTTKVLPFIYPTLVKLTPFFFIFAWSSIPLTCWCGLRVRFLNKGWALKKLHLNPKWWALPKGRKIESLLGKRPSHPCKKWTRWPLMNLCSTFAFEYRQAFTSSLGSISTYPFCEGLKQGKMCHWWPHYKHWGSGPIQGYNTREVEPLLGLALLYGTWGTSRCICKDMDSTVMLSSLLYQESLSPTLFLIKPQAFFKYFNGLTLVVLFSNSTPS